MKGQERTRVSQANITVSKAAMGKCLEYGMGLKQLLGSVWMLFIICRIECELLLYVTETIDLLGTGAQDGHFDFHTAPEL